MLEYLIQTDTSIFLWLNSFHNDFLDCFMKLSSSKLIWVCLYVSILAALWRSYGPRTVLIVVIASGVAVLIADQLTSSVLRPMFNRMRPSNLDNPISMIVHIVDEYRGGPYGFPSCHASNTFCIAVLMSLIFRRWPFTLMMLLWALLNCYSRIYLGVHYPGDLLAGCIIGSLVGWLIYVLASYVIRGWSGYSGEGKNNRTVDVRNRGRLYKFNPSVFAVFIFFLTLVFITLCSLVLAK